MTRVGVEKRHFRFAIEYNTAFNEEKSKLGYVSFKLGAILFGNRIKE